jgi:hypothetical protein
MKITLIDDQDQALEVSARMEEILLRLLEIRDEVDTIGLGAVTLHLRGKRVQPEVTRHYRRSEADH